MRSSPPMDSHIATNAVSPAAIRRRTNGLPWSICSASTSSSVDRSGPDESVRVGNHAQARVGVESAATGARRVLVGLDRDAHAREARDVVDATAGRGEVEVQQRDRDSISVHDVLGTDVVVTDDDVADRIRIAHLVAPGRARRGDEADRRVVEAAQQRCRRREHGVGLRPGGKRRHRYVARDEHEALAAVRLDGDDLGGRIEPDRADVPQQRVDRRRVRVGRSQHVRSDAHHCSGIADAALEHFWFVVHGTTSTTGKPRACRAASVAALSATGTSR